MTRVQAQHELTGSGTAATAQRSSRKRRIERDCSRFIYIIAEYVWGATLFQKARVIRVP